MNSKARSADTQRAPKAHLNPERRHLGQMQAEIGRYIYHICYPSPAEKSKATTRRVSKKSPGQNSTSLKGRGQREELRKQTRCPQTPAERPRYQLTNDSEGNQWLRRVASTPKEPFFITPSLKFGSPPSTNKRNCEQANTGLKSSNQSSAPIRLNNVSTKVVDQQPTFWTERYNQDMEQR